MNLSKTQQTLLELTSAALLSHQVKQSYEIDWSKLYQESMAQTVFPLVYSVIKEQIPKENKTRWSNTFYRIVSSNIRVNYEHTELNSLMEQAGIPYVILKGVASACYYPDPNLRTMGDVDFLVKKDHLDLAKKVLKSANFVRTDDYEHMEHIAYHRAPNSVWELHWRLPGIPQGKAGQKVSLALSEIIENAHLENSCVLPNDFHHGLIMLVHTASHLTNSGIGLRHLCDWAAFVNKMPKFESIFKETLQSCGLWRFAQLLTQLSIKYLHLPEQYWAMENIDDKLLDAMILDIFAGGNFGTKDAERINQAKLMTNKKNGQIDGKSIGKKLLSVMNEKARIAMPICQKNTALLPIGWLYAGGRHLVRIIKGERPEIHFGNMVEGAKVRREIYKQFHLYE